MANLEGEELVLFACESAQDAEEVGVVVVLQDVAHLGDVVEAEEGDVLVALLGRAARARGGAARGVEELEARLADLQAVGEEEEGELGALLQQLVGHLVGVQLLEEVAVRGEEGGLMEK